MNDKKLTLNLVSWENLPYLKGKMSESFAVAVKEHFGESDSGDGPPAEELEEAYQRPESKIFMIMKGCSPVGGAVLKNNEITRHNAGIISKFAGCPTGEQWFKDRGQWADRNYLPNPGDIIFLDWASDGIDGLADHVGIVERCEGGVVYTVEGNMTNSCKQRQYTVGYYEICGYGVPAY